MLTRKTDVYVCARAPRWLAGSRFSLTIIADKIVTVQTDRVDDKSITPELTLIYHMSVTLRRDKQSSVACFFWNCR